MGAMIRMKKIVKISGIVLLSILIIVLSATLIFVVNTLQEVKDLDVSLANVETQVCCIYDSDGKKISNVIGNTYVTYEDISPITIKAFVSIEDKDFFKHNGLNYKRMLKAMITNIATGSYSQGASTITQQLVKNKFLTNEKTLKRKVKEIYLARKVESRESKEKIIEQYLNSIYYGNGAYGIYNASKRFFGKEPKELTLSESCVLAGVINSPTRYSPINNMDKCTQRRNLVLSCMLEDGYITNEEYNDCISKDIELDIEDLRGIDNMDLYSQNVLREASSILNISQDEILNKGYKIFTYQDVKKQSILDEIINDEKYYAKNSYGNIADSLGIIVDNKNCGVVAVSGKSDYSLVDIRRQPGSLVKPPLVYAPALEEKIIYPCSKILDEKINVSGYSPKNVGDVYYGYVSLDDAIAKSLNVPAVKVCNELGIEKCKEYGEKCGIEFDDDDTGLAIALGGLTNGLTIQNIVSAYTPFFNSGMYSRCRYISKIISPNKIVIYVDNMSETNYISKENAYLLTKSMQYSVKNGTSKKLQNLSYQVAGKTGTVGISGSNLNTDAYSLAYTTEDTMCVWLGNYTMKKEFNLLGNNNGGTYATEMIRDTFKEIYRSHQPADFKKPDGIISLPVDLINLGNNHQVTIADNIPARYQRYEEFSSDNIPEYSSSDYLNNMSLDFSLTPLGNSVEISLDTNDYITYYIYRIDSLGNQKLISRINDSNDYVKVVDNDIHFNKEYIYYIVGENLFGKKFSSQQNSIKIKKSYNSLIESNDNSSWIFA